MSWINPSRLTSTDRIMFRSTSKTTNMCINRTTYYNMNQQGEHHTKCCLQNYKNYLKNQQQKIGTVRWILNISTFQIPPENRWFSFTTNDNYHLVPHALTKWLSLQRSRLWHEPNPDRMASCNPVIQLGVLSHMYALSPFSFSKTGASSYFTGMKPGGDMWSLQWSLCSDV